ncbi:MAG: helix-turn-helix transcriptional regulator [Candidatus Nitronauta litoralis]|uniref:Helix-turn-helix transcriptional regulator n=1 Tax=Candidatus Nitronauta litoralis TaxID=2705533 RepID=A0A7T0FZ75_9BACT|nr:MAG: helix-turn-helix transcriptional regulator [Candidatus Nitronauta litoralis]
MEDKKAGAAKYLGRRLREWRKTLPLKSFELARLIKISQGSLSDIENDKSLPSADTLAKLYQHTSVNIIWLLTGKGSMTRTETGSGGEGMTDVVQESAEAYGEDQRLMELIAKLVRIYRKGGPEKRAHLVGFLNGADPGE